MKISNLGLALVFITSSFTTQPVFAQDLIFDLTNLSSRALAVFQTSPSGVQSWEEDIFGDAILPSGNTVPVTIADGQEVCVYDMRFILEDGSELEHYEVDLCDLGEYTLYDEE